MSHHHRPPASLSGHRRPVNWPFYTTSELPGLYLVGRGAFLLAETIQKIVPAIEPEKNTYWRLITQNWCPFPLFFILVCPTPIRLNKNLVWCQYFWASRFPPERSLSIYKNRKKLILLTFFILYVFPYSAWSYVYPLIKKIEKKLQICSFFRGSAIAKKICPVTWNSYSIMKVLLIRTFIHSLQSYKCLSLRHWQCPDGVPSP